MKLAKTLIKATPLYGLANSIKHRLTDSANRLIFIHVGKCGGASLWSAINESDVIKRKFSAVSKVHIRKPPLNRKSSYLIVVRNPVSRALSAFNWRYKLVVEDRRQKDRFEGEHAILAKYRSLNSLAEALYRDGVLDEAVATEFRSIHHLKEDIAFYMADLLKHLSAGQVFAVLVTEFLNEDIERELGVSNDRQVHENRSATESAKMFLSDEARANLRRFLSADYESLEKLSKLKELPPRRYQVLMR